jgi:hypothetical protein
VVTGTVSSVSRHHRGGPGYSQSPGGATPQVDRKYNSGAPRGQLLPCWRDGALLVGSTESSQKRLEGHHDLPGKKMSQTPFTQIIRSR